MAFDYNNDITKQFIVAQSILQLLFLYLRIAVDNDFNRSILKMAVAIEGYILVFTIGGVLHAFLDTAENKALTGFFFCFVLAPISSTVCVYILGLRLGVILEQEIEVLRKKDDVSQL